MIRKIIGSFLCVCCFVFHVIGQTTKQEMFQTLEKTGSVYYVYPTDHPKQTPVPSGYTPFYVSHFGRHGSRYLMSDQDYRWVIDLLIKAKNENAITPLGVDVLNRLNLLWNEVALRGGDLTPLGVRQHRGIAERMFQTYPSVFSDTGVFTARATTVMRCALSMDAFCERLKELNPSLSISRDASNRNMGYLNFHTSESSLFMSDKGPWHEQYRKFKEEHTNPIRFVTSLFSRQDFIEKSVHPSNCMWAFYWIASDMQNVETNVSFYDLFTKQELFDLWQCVNYHFYVCDANASINNQGSLKNAKPLLEHILSTANKYINEHKIGATFRFAHDGNLIPLAALMHLNNSAASSAIPADFYKVWADYKIAPMAGNIQLVFCKKGEDVLVKFMLNEKEAKIPIVTDQWPYYSWNAVNSYYIQLMKNL